VCVPDRTSFTPVCLSVRRTCAAAAAAADAAGGAAAGGGGGRNFGPQAWLDAAHRAGWTDLLLQLRAEAVELGEAGGQAGECLSVCLCPTSAGSRTSFVGSPGCFSASLLAWKLNQHIKRNKNLLFNRCLSTAEWPGIWPSACLSVCWWFSSEWAWNMSISLSVTATCVFSSAQLACRRSAHAAPAACVYRSACSLASSWEHS
jgi:hypothetical protein